MCDEVNRAEKPEAQAAAKAAAKVAPQVAAAATATAKAATHKDAVQVAAAATAKPQATAQPAAHKDAAHKDTDSKRAQVVDPEFARAENEDDDGYDPYSDRRPVSEPLFERDPWS